MKRTSILQINLDSDVCFTCRRLDGKPQLHRGQESSLDTEFQFHNLELDSRNTSPSLKTGCFQKSSWSSISLLTKFAPRRVIALISDLHSATQMLSTVRSTLLHRRFRSIDLDTRNTYQQACQRAYRKQFRRFTDDQPKIKCWNSRIRFVIRVVRWRTTRIPPGAAESTGFRCRGSCCPATPCSPAFAHWLDRIASPTENRTQCNRQANS